MTEAGGSLTMVETDGVVSWVERETKIENTNASIEHLEE